ncbi:hypothetical protein, partial [Burkholderia ubonensis]|uniref:hypothetical protein n=1 Tax=Burkholderia ubonensis TaxID=101571 RepID=UPI001E3B9F7E
AGSALRVRAIDSVRSGDEIELSQRNFYLNSIASGCAVCPAAWYQFAFPKFVRSMSVKSKN